MKTDEQKRQSNYAAESGSFGSSEIHAKHLQARLEGALPLPHSIDAYVRERQLSLAASVAGRVPIYLDSRFWIDLRRASDQSDVGSRARPLLLALKEAVGAGKAFCPISASTFIEMLKHNDADVRRSTGRLVDQLSLGVTFVSLDELLQAEIRWFVDNPGDFPLEPLKEPVWTRLAYALGTRVPVVEGLGPSELLAFQTAAFDSLWEITLEEFATEQPESFRPDFQDTADRITRDSAQHVNEIPTYDAAYKAELAPMAEMGAGIFAEQLRRKASEAGVRSEETGEALSLYRNVIRNALAFGKARQALRSAHIRASLYAIIRHNKGRKFRPNDIFDIEHAVSGVGYCRAFFTEGSLGTAARQPPLSLDRLYGTLVTSDIEEATRFVLGLK